MDPVEAARPSTERTLDAAVHCAVYARRVVVLGGETHDYVQRARGTDRTVRMTAALADAFAGHGLRAEVWQPTVHTDAGAVAEHLAGVLERSGQTAVIVDGIETFANERVHGALVVAAVQQVAVDPDIAHGGNTLVLVERMGRSPWTLREAPGVTALQLVPPKCRERREFVEGVVAAGGGVVPAAALDRLVRLSAGLRLDELHEVVCSALGGTGSLEPSAALCAVTMILARLGMRRLGARDRQALDPGEEAAVAAAVDAWERHGRASIVEFGPEVPVAAAAIAMGERLRAPVVALEEMLPAQVERACLRLAAMAPCVVLTSHRSHAAPSAAARWLQSLGCVVVTASR